MSYLKSKHDFDCISLRYDETTNRYEVFNNVKDCITNELEEIEPNNRGLGIMLQHLDNEGLITGVLGKNPCIHSASHPLFLSGTFKISYTGILYLENYSSLINEKQKQIEFQERMVKALENIDNNTSSLSLLIPTLKENNKNLEEIISILADLYNLPSISTEEEQQTSFEQILNKIFILHFYIFIIIQKFLFYITKNDFI